MCVRHKYSELFLKLFHFLIKRLHNLIFISKCGIIRVYNLYGCISLAATICNKEEKKMLKKIFKSRMLWLVTGIIIGLFVIPMIPISVVFGILKFLWGQKWGVLIGIGFCTIIHIVGRGFGGFRFRLVRDSDEEEDDDEV